MSPLLPSNSPLMVDTDMAVNKHTYVSHSFVTNNKCEVCLQSIGAGNRGCKCYACGSCVHSSCHEQIQHLRDGQDGFAQAWHCSPEEMMRGLMSPLERKVSPPMVDIDMAHATMVQNATKSRQSVRSSHVPSVVMGGDTL